jgi:RimJ/RimL family protein N-acetyltransferase
MGTLEFIPATAKVLRQLSEEPEEFAAEHGVRLHELSQSVAEHSRAFLKSYAYETRPEFLGYLAIDGGTQEHVGMCSFKGPPADGELEMVYFTFPGHEGMGIATAMARFLIERAREMPGIERVTAHTLPEWNAATRVLEKIGMRRAGDEEEDGGVVWRWETGCYDGVH